MTILNSCNVINKSKNLNIENSIKIEINHHYIEIMAIKIFSDEYKVDDFLNAMCSPDFNKNIWTCYISQYVAAFENNKYTSNRKKPHDWVLVIDFINERFEINEMRFD